MTTILPMVVALLVFLLSTIPVSAQESVDNKAEIAHSSKLFFGQKPSGKRAKIFASELLKFETYDSPIISQDETWIIIFSMEKGIKFYKMINGNLSVTTNPLNFDIPQNFNGMAISTSENRVYFLLWENDDENFYYIERHKNYWTPLKSLGEEINSFKTHWQFSVATNENLYFSSGGILVSVFDGDSHLKPVPLKLEDDSNLPGATPFIAPDESYIICRETGSSTSIAA